MFKIYPFSGCIMIICVTLSLVMASDKNALSDNEYSKHFIVGPTSFHWWGAWLNQNPDKICLRLPEDLNPSNNKDFWPESWITI